MKFCELTLPSPEENLACDEALLEFCEAGREHELLRFWEPLRYFVVVGYANQAATEVHLPFCERNTIPVLRRCTGGGAVLQGPGVLNYSLVLRIDDSGPGYSISSTNKFVLSRHQQALTSFLKAPVQTKGQTDLALGGLKFCGNAQRRKKRFLLFHGSFLLHLDLELLEKALPMPSRQPDYRLNRSHSEFLMNLRIAPSQLKAVLLKEWKADSPLTDVPSEEIASLVRNKYGSTDWNFKF
jgi:lipoate-protein ligase A